VTESVVVGVRVKGSSRSLERPEKKKERRAVLAVPSDYDWITAIIG